MNVFQNEIVKTADDILKIKEDGDLCFAVLSDSFVSDEGEETCANIRAVDEKVHFDFVCHLGNIINGNNPKRPTVELLKNELDMYRNASESGVLFITCGQNDGWRDERYIGQSVTGIITDDFWCKETEFIDKSADVIRPVGKPYFYVDVTKSNARLIFLSSYFTQHDTEIEFFQKHVGFDAEQIKWLKNEALCGCEGKSVFLFSHRIPYSRFETGSDQYLYKGNSTEPFLALLQQAKKRGIITICHFAGAYGIDESFCHGGINFSVMGSQLAKGRTIGTIEQDLWDAVLVKNKERKIHLFRFGSGKDRVIEF